MQGIDVFLGEEPDPATLPGAFAPAPRTGFVDNFKAAYRGTIAAGRTDSREVTLRDAYDPIVDQLNAGFRKAEGWTLVSPDADRMFRNPYRGRSFNPAFDAAGGVPFEEQRIWTEILKRRQTDPGFMKHLGKTREEFIASLKARSARVLQEEAAVRDRSTTGGTIGGFAGTVVGGFSDPVNLGSLVLGAGPARSVLQGALREATINAGIEAASTPAIAQRRAEIGVPMTAGEAAENIAAAGVVGFVIGGGVEIGGRAYGRLRDGRSIEELSERELVEEVGKLGDLSPEVAAARNLLKEKVEIDAHNPGPDTPEGQMLHRRNLEEALDRIADDGLESASPPRSPDRTAEERMAMFSEPAGEGQRQQIEMLNHDIRAARLANEIRPAISEAAAAEAAQAVPEATILGGAPVVSGSSAVEQFKSRVRSAESSGNDAAVARDPKTGELLSSATGRFQFTADTWLRYYKRRFGDQGLSDTEILAKRTDGQLQELLMDDLTADNAAALRRAGHEPTAGSLYLAHFLGPGGANKLLGASRATPIESVLPANVVKANRTVLAGKSVGDVVDWARGKMGDTAPAEPVTVAMAEEVIEGEVVPIVRPLDELLAESDADDAFLRELEACLL